MRSVVQVHLGLPVPFFNEEELKYKFYLKMEENPIMDEFRIEDRLTWGRSSVGRAPALQAGGQEFESPRLHHVL